MNITQSEALLIALTEVKEIVDGTHTAWALYINAEDEAVKKVLEESITESFYAIERMLEAI